MKYGGKYKVKPFDLSQVTAEEDLLERCKNTALTRLTYRSQSVEGMREYLLAKGFYEDIADKCIAFLLEYDYLNDRRYACEYYRVNRPKGKSESRILREIADKGVDPETAKAAIEEMLNSDEYRGVFKSDKQQAMEIGAKMLKNHMAEGREIDEKFINKVGRRLMTQGYSSGICYYVMDKIRNYRLKEFR